MRHGVVRVIDDVARIDAAAWNELVDAQPSATPFVRHEYLLALQASASACDETGWSTRFVCIFDGDDERGAAAGPDRPGARLLAACPLYLKSHSYGEYVFDWAWADAYRRHGLAYYPKLLGAVPFTPVSGPRLLATDDAQRDALLSAIGRLVREAGLSSAHLLFLDEADQRAAARAGWMARSTVQFHWLNRAPRPYSGFDDFLASLQRDKRRKIAQERRKVAEAGVTFRASRGPGIDRVDWDFFYRCYELTYAAHGGAPYLTRDFFTRVAATMPEDWLLFVAERGGQRVASSLIAIDAQRGHAFGRYWGATEPIDCLHFEACYYQPLAWCIDNGFHRFEGGAQGEHKMARGLVPVPTASAHRLADPRFAGAVAEFLRLEGRAVEDYLGELEQRTPFKTAGP
jgi:predicted N-acyltransferase